MDDDTIQLAKNLMITLNELMALRSRVSREFILEVLRVPDAPETCDYKQRASEIADEMAGRFADILESTWNDISEVIHDIDSRG